MIPVIGTIIAWLVFSLVVRSLWRTSWRLRVSESDIRALGDYPIELAKYPTRNLSQGALARDLATLVPHLSEGRRLVTLQVALERIAEHEAMLASRKRVSEWK